jgi:hypothetical protein
MRDISLFRRFPRADLLIACFHILDGFRSQPSSRFQICLIILSVIQHIDHRVSLFKRHDMRRELHIQRERPKRKEGVGAAGEAFGDGLSLG